MSYFYILDLDVNNICKLGIVFILTSVLSACGDGNSEDLRAYVESVKARPAGKVEPLRDPVVYESYRYQSDSERDPLKPSFTASKIAPVDTKSSIGGPNTQRDRQALEHFPIDTLRYIGSLQRDEAAWGLIKTPDGGVVPIKVGDYMGQDYGQVKSIDPERVELLEVIPDGIGGWERRTVSLVING